MLIHFRLPQWYAIATAGIAALLLLRHIGSVCSAFLISRFQFVVLKFVVYPLLVRRRWWNWIAVSRLQGATIGSYVIINGFCMGLGIKTTSDLIIRSGLMASINMIPLFLGGRTNTLASFLGISLHTYYLAHHWIGRIVILQSLIHVFLVIAHGVPWTFDSSQISGISAISALALIFLLSLVFVRRLMYEFFLQTHLILAFVAALALLKHLLPTTPGSYIFPAVSLSLWGFNAVLRFTRMAYSNLGGRRPRRTGQATITQLTGDTMRVSLRLRRSMKMLPGEYVYLFFSDMGLRRNFQSHPYVITWWDNSLKAMNLSFLIKSQCGMSAELLARKSVRTVTVDGPYGKNLHLESYETVILVAKGIGIAGILPYVRHMTYRKVSKDQEHAAYRRGLITRKIDIYWVLEDNSQEAWVSDFMVELAARDSDKLILTFSCFYLNKKLHPPPIPPTNLHWRFFYKRKPLPIIKVLMMKQVQRSPGRTKVVVCGDSGFSDSIRSIVLTAMNESKDVEFAETEFQPQDALGTDQIEPDEQAVVSSNRRGRLLKSFRLSRSVDEKVNIRTHSGVASKLQTLDEKAEDFELEDLDEKLEDIDDGDTQSSNEKMDVAEIV